MSRLSRLGVTRNSGSVRNGLNENPDVPISVTVWDGLNDNLSRHEITGIPRVSPERVLGASRHTHTPRRTPSAVRPNSVRPSTVRSSTGVRPSTVRPSSDSGLDYFSRNVGTYNLSSNMNTEPQPAVPLQQPQEDDSIASQEEQFENFDFQEGYSYNHPTSSIPTSQSHQSLMWIPPAPKDFHKFDEWVYLHFQDIVPAKSVLDITDMLLYTLKMEGYKDVIKFRYYTPHTYLCRLGKDHYDANLKFLFELHIIIDFVCDQLDTYGQDHQWNYDIYLTKREKYLGTGNRFPTSDHVILAAQTPHQGHVPPPYSPESSVLRSMRPSSPLQTPRSVHSYRSSTPHAVDSNGSAYGMPNFGGGMDKDWDYKQAKPGPRSLKGPTQRPGSPIRPFGSQWEQHDRSNHSHDSNNSTRSKRTAHLRYEAAPRPRSPFGLKHRWDGQRSTFESYQRMIEGYLIMVGAGYIINPHFLSNYEKEGVEYLLSDDFWARYNTSIKQAQFDKKYLYGILVTTNRNRDNKHILKYANSQDGISTWIAFRKSYAHDGSKELKIEKLEDAINTAFTAEYSGGMQQYIDDFQTTMERIDTLAPEDYSDDKKKRLLIRNVRHVQEIAHLVQRCRDDESMSYDDAAAYLRVNSILIDTLSRPTKKASPSTMLRVETNSRHQEEELESELDIEETYALVNHMIAETSISHAYNALTSRTLRENLRIPNAIWRRLEPELQEKIREIRDEIHREGKPKSSPSHYSTRDNNSRHDKASDEILPSQYPNKKPTQPSVKSMINLVGQLDDPSDDSDTDNECLAYNVTRDDEEDTSQDIEIRVHLEHAKAVNRHFALVDSGADSTLLGKHAQVLHYTGRYATLVGYDPEKTWSKRIPIVTAYLKVKAHNDIPVLLKINEAPYFEDNPVTLLSEYQVREHGYVIDSTATKHRKSATEYGTQRLVLSDHVHVPFEDRGGIMGFEILEITDDDFDGKGEPLYDVFEITGADQWKPARFRDTPINNVTTDLPSEEPKCEDSVQPQTITDQYYFDPEDALQETKFSPANLSVDKNHILSHDEFHSGNFEPNNVDVFLTHLAFDELTGHEETKSEYYGYPAIQDPQSSSEIFDDFNSFAFATASWHRVMYDQIDPKKVSPYLAFRPLDIVKATLASTTQLARMTIRHPLRRHLKSRAPFANVTRLDEPVSTDPIFANCASLQHGYLGAQVWYGTKSHCINVNGFKHKSAFPRLYRDFIRENGAPSLLRRDNAKEEQSEEVLRINRDLYIKDGFSEPHNQQQNPVESRAIKWLKESSHVLMDRTGAP